jgi:hypothetical protein
LQIDTCVNSAEDAAQRRPCNAREPCSAMPCRAHKRRTFASDIVVIMNNDAIICHAKRHIVIEPWVRGHPVGVDAEALCTSSNTQNNGYCVT